MEWKYVKQLKTVELINDFECMVKYAFCEAFRRCVMVNNGGRPAKKLFDTDKAVQRQLKSFLSFNKEDRETVWKIFQWNREELTDKYVPFAIDGFGNLICFDANNDRVVFIDHETMAVEVIAKDFDAFMAALYD